MLRQRALVTLVVLAFAIICLVEGNPTSAVAVNEDNSVLPSKNEKSARLSHRSVMIEIARELIARTTGNSQVLSLSVTNLVILLVLKALLLGAALFSYGAWRRSADEGYVRSFRAQMGRGISEGEILLILSYLMGGTRENETSYDCLYLVACEEMDEAKEYLSASKMLLKGAQLFNGSIDQRYVQIVHGLQEAIDYGNIGNECAAKYKCKK